MIIIKQLTKHCERSDCRIEHRGCSTTLMGWAQTYDKNGDPVGRDPNTTRSHYACHACSAEWVEISGDGESRITRVRDGSHPQQESSIHE